MAVAKLRNILRPAIIARLDGRQLTSTELATELRQNPRTMSGLCTSMELVGELSRSGAVVSRNGNRVALWCLPGQEMATDRDSEKVVVEPMFQPPVVLEYPTTLTGRLCGDPAPGRSALDMRRGIAPVDIGDRH